jgi:hypothetical protein
MGRNRSQTRKIQANSSTPSHNPILLIRPIPACDYLCLRSHAPGIPEDAGGGYRVGCAARRRGAADALFNLRKEKVHGAGGAADDAEGIQIALGLYVARPARYNYARWPWGVTVVNRPTAGIGPHEIITLKRPFRSIKG